MIIAIFLVIASILALAFVFSIALSRSLRGSSTAAAPRIQPIDIQSFRNLVDPEEAEYLRRRLSVAEFRVVQRERLRAMAAYVQTVGRNAAILVQIGQRALASNDPNTEEAARQLVNDGLLLHSNAKFALFKIYIALAWPSSSLRVSPVLSGYERLSGSAMLLGRLRDPAAPVRISTSF